MRLEVASTPFFLNRIALRVGVIAAALLVLILLIWQGITAGGNPDPTDYRAGSLAGVLDIGVLVFREGLECILVLTAITASMAKSRESYGNPVAAGVAVGMLATLATWFVAVGVVEDLTKSI